MSKIITGTLGDLATAAAGSAVNIEGLADVLIEVAGSATLDATAAMTLEISEDGVEWAPTPTSSAFAYGATASGVYALTVRPKLIRAKVSAIATGTFAVRFSGRRVDANYHRSASLGTVSAQAAGTPVDISGLEKVVVLVPGTFTATIDVQVSYNGTTWTTIGTATNAAASFALPLPAMAVRYNCTAFSSATGCVIYVGGHKTSGKQRFGYLGAFPNAHRLTSTPSTATATPTGGSGTSYAYKICAVGADGKEAPASTAATASGGATLSPTVYNTITGTAVAGAVSYNIYRSSSAGTPSSVGKIGNVTDITVGLVDNGIVGDTTTASTVNATGTGAGTAYDVSDLDSFSVRVTCSAGATESITIEGSGDGLSWAPLHAAYTSSDNLSVTTAVKLLRANMTACTTTSTAVVMFGGVNNDLQG